MPGDAVAELVQRCRDRVARMRPRPLSHSEDAATEGTYEGLVAAYEELRAALTGIRDATGCPDEVRSQVDTALSDERNSLHLDLFSVGFTLGTRAGLRVGITVAQVTTNDRAMLLLKVMGDNSTADALLAHATLADAAT